MSSRMRRSCGVSDLSSSGSRSPPLRMRSSTRCVTARVEQAAAGRDGADGVDEVGPAHLLEQVSGAPAMIALNSASSSW